MLVEKGREVEIVYTIKDADGNIVGDTDNQTLVFTQGDGTAFPAIEKNVLGMAYKAKTSFKMLPGEAYGEYYDELVLEIPRSKFKNLDENTTDDIIWTSATGEKVRLYIKEIKEDIIIADANHPLSGKELYCELQITSITDSKPELEKEEAPKPQQEVPATSPSTNQDN